MFVLLFTTSLPLAENLYDVTNCYSNVTDPNFKRCFPASFLVPESETRKVSVGAGKGGGGC